MIKKRFIIAFIITLAVLTLTNKFWLIFKAAHHAHFEFFVFTIILILSYLFGLKLTEYLADFKEIKHQSRIEIIFLAIFFVMLFIPMSHIDTKSQISERENRTLAKYKPFITNGQINYTYGTDFNNWFNDRFNLRLCLIKLSTFKNKYIIYSHSDGITYLNRRNNWIFTDNIWNVSNNWTQPTLEEIKTYVNTYNKIKEFVDRKKVDTYIVAVPTKEKTMIKFQDARIKSYKNEIERITYINEYLKKINKRPIIYPLKTLSEYDGSEMIYYKTDHHYTDYGSILVANDLYRTIKNNYNNFQFTSKYKFYEDYKPHGTWDDNIFNGSLYDRMNLNTNKVFDVKYKYFDLQQSGIAANKNSNIYKLIYTNNNAFNNLKLYIIGDSFVHSFGKCLSYSFKNVIVRRDNIAQHKLYAKELFSDIDKEKPDILVFVYAAPHIDRFLKTFFDGE